MWPKITPARRIDVVEGLSPVVALEEPGDYYGPVVLDGDEGRPSVWFLLPTARNPDAQPGERSIHRVASPPHVFRECGDGSLEIRESIGCVTPGKKQGEPGYHYWHGYLDEGNIWRQLEN